MQAEAVPTPALRAAADKIWRTVGTGFSFAVFGAGALVLSLGLCPVFSLLPGTKEDHARRTQLIIHFSCRVFVALMEKLGLLSVQIEGLHNIPQGSGALIVANHPTLIDAVIMLSLFRRLDCITKPELWTRFYMRRLLEEADYAKSETSLEFIGACSERINAGHKLLVFPEGTRSLPGAMRKFRRGPSAVAVKNGGPLYPVVISSSPPTLSKGSPWYEIAPAKVTIRLRFFEPINITAILQNSRTPFIAARRLNEELEEFFRRKLREDGFGTAGSGAEELYH